jgi:hypothetical protein
MRVKAKFAKGKFGFSGGMRRRNGDVFDIDPKDFSETWMVKLDEDKPKKVRRVSTSKDDDEVGGL